MLKNKKAVQHELFFLIFQIILITATAVVLMTYINKLSKSTFYEKDFLTKDLALLTGTILASPGNIYYTYDLKEATPNFTFIFNNQEAIIQELIAGRQATTKFPYAGNKLLKISTLPMEKPKKIMIENSGNLLTIKEELTSNPKKLKYPYVKTEGNLAEKKISLLSGILNNPTTGEAYTEENSFAEAIKIRLRAQATSMTKPILAEAAVDKRFSLAQEGEANLVILFNNNTKNSFIIYIPSNPDIIKQNRKLASLVINNIEKEKIKPIIIPIESDIQIPSINLDIDNKILKEYIVDINTAVAKAVEEYYT